MEIQIRQATIQDLNVLMQWRMEVLHEVFSIPSERSVTELESENRRYYQTELPQGGHIACFAYVGEEIVGCGGICLYHEMPSPDNLNGKCAYLMNIYTRPQFRRLVSGIFQKYILTPQTKAGRCIKQSVLPI